MCTYVIGNFLRHTQNTHTALHTYILLGTTSLKTANSTLTSGCTIFSSLPAVCMVDGVNVLFSHLTPVALYSGFAIYLRLVLIRLCIAYINKVFKQKRLYMYP